MTDQADGLRRLVRGSPGTTALAERPSSFSTPHAAGAPSVCRSLVFTSGKGGVGTSNIALNLALALAARGQRVILVDADVGLANLDLLCGLSPVRDLGDVLADDGPISGAVIEGPEGLRMVAGAHAMRTLAADLDEAPARIAEDLAVLEDEADADFLIIDAGSGLRPGLRTLAEAADEVVIVTTPEPTAMADAHAAIGRLRGGPALRLVVNQAASRAEAEDCLTRICASSRQFHGIVVRPLGSVRFDPRVGRAVRRRRPLLVEYPHTRASRCVRRLARTLVEERRPRVRPAGLLAAMAPIRHVCWD